MKTVVVLPTYNERATLATIVRELLSLKPDRTLEVLIVDDHSPDGTGEIADQLAADHPGKVSVLHRDKKRGLGTAYIAGFDRARAEGAEIIVQMDADLSHEPRALLPMLAALSTADLVLGSRYCAGGSVANWNILRRIISRLGNWYARLLLKLPYHDLTGGYKCFKRRVLDQIDYQHAQSIGYNFQIEMTLLAHDAGFRIMEVPIQFIERPAGSSKFDAGIMVESFRKILVLKRRRHRNSDARTH